MTLPSSAPLSGVSRDASLFADIPDPVARPTSATTRESTDPKATGVAAGPTRADVRRTRALALGGVLLWIVAVVGVLGMRQDVATASSVCQIAIPTTLGIAALAVALSKGRVGLGPSVAWTVLLAIVPLAVFVVVGIAFAAPAGSTVSHSPLTCGAVELFASVVSLGILATGLRRSSVTNERWRGALVGSAIGLAWAGLWGIHCVDESALHIVIGHGYPVVLCAVLGAFLLSRVARVR